MVSESVMYIIPMAIPVSTISDKMHNNSAIPRSFRRIGCFSLGRFRLIDSLQGPLRFLDWFSFSCQTQVSVCLRQGSAPARLFGLLLGSFVFLGRYYVRTRGH